MVDDEDESVFVDVSEIAGAEPPVHDRGAGGRRVAWYHASS